MRGPPEGIFLTLSHFFLAFSPRIQPKEAAHTSGSNCSGESHASEFPSYSIPFQPQNNLVNVSHRVLYAKIGP